jgi:predicted DNA binding protein
MRTLRITLSTADGTFHSADRALAHSDRVVRDSLLGIDWLSGGDAVVLYRIEAESAADIETQLDDIESVHGYDVTHEDGDTFSVFLHIAGEDPLASLFDLVERNALLIDRPLVFNDDGIALRVVGTESSFQSAMAEVPADVNLTIESTSGYAPGEQTLRTQLTARQQEAVETAMELGYYETPRQVTYEDIAEALDCAPSTANELLRRAEGKLVSSVFEV